jgi:hypothetical protein
MSYVMTLLLLGVATGFAVWRSRKPVERPRGGDPPWLTEGREAFRAECADCHPDPADVAPPSWSGSAADGVIDLLLRGEARIGERVVTGHPDFDSLADSRLAAILGFLATAGAESRRVPAVPPVTPSAIEARRSLPR